MKVILRTLVLLLFVGLLYGATLKNGFIHDDHGQVETNKFIQSLMYLPKIFTGCIWESAVGNCKETYYYRPLQSLSYMLTYQISSSPWAFHMVNLLYFSIAIFLTYLLVMVLTGNYPVSVITAGIFLLHPLNTEVVSWVAAVPELLYTVFILSSTLYFIRYRKMTTQRNLIFVCVSYALAIFSKEPAVFLPVIYVLLDVLYYKSTFRSWFRWSNLKIYVYCGTIFFFYMWARFQVLGGLGEDPTTRLTLLQHVAVFFDLFGAYFLKLLWPYPLNLFYPYHASYIFTDVRILTGVGLFSAYVSLCIISLKNKWNTIALMLSWYGVFLAPSLLFTSSIGENLFAERHVFASTIGFSYLIAVLLQKFLSPGKWQRYLTVVIVIMLGICSVFLIIRRNSQWKDDKTIYTDTLQKSPDADLIRYNLAFLYSQSNTFSEAKKQYGIILAGNSWRGIDKVYNNLGDIARKEKDFPLAISYFQKSLEINAYHLEAYNNLGALSLEQGDILTSLSYLCKANRINPRFQAANSNYDTLVATIQSMDEKSYTTLFKSVLAGPLYHLEKGTPFVFKNGTCVDTQGCLFIFSANPSVNAFLFLAGAKAQDGSIVRPRRMGIHQTTGDIIFDMDEKWKNKPLEFSFPTCDSNYYQTTAVAK